MDDEKRIGELLILKPDSPSLVLPVIFEKIVNEDEKKSKKEQNQKFEGEIRIRMPGSAEAKERFSLNNQVSLENSTGPESTSENVNKIILREEVDPKQKTVP